MGIWTWQHKTCRMKHIKGEGNFNTGVENKEESNKQMNLNINIKNKLKLKMLVNRPRNMTHWSSEWVLSVVKNAPEDLLRYYDLISTIPIVVKRLLFPFLDIWCHGADPWSPHTCKPICGKNEMGNATGDTNKRFERGSWGTDRLPSGLQMHKNYEQVQTV